MPCLRARSYLLSRALAPLAAACCLLAAPLPARAVPQADHVRIEAYALRLNVNGRTERHQLKVIVTLSSSDPTALEDAGACQLVIRNPGGTGVSFSPRNVEVTPKRFKAGHAKMLFKAVADDAVPELSNVPQNFFSAAGPYSLQVAVRGQKYRGSFSFLTAVALSAEQQGAPVANFSLKAEEPLDVFTEPAEFGPVYYKRQDLTNFVFQLANMDQALESGDYHPPVESPMYVFQVRIGDVNGGPTRLLDPSRYIEGYAPHMIRSERTSTPLHFSPGDFKPGDVVVLDFMRQDTLKPNEGFSGPGLSGGAEGEGASAQIVVQDRAIYALAVEAQPSAEEIGAAAAAATD